MKCQLAVFLTLFAGISCATQQATLAPDQGRDVVTRYHGHLAVDVHGSVDPSQHVVSGSVDSVWTTLPGIYEQLEIEPTLVNRGGYHVGNTRFVTRSIDGNRLSRYLRCGSSVGNSDNADTYRVTMSVITSVRVDDDRQTVLQTEVTGSASPRHVSGNAVICTTTGRLERRIAELVSTSLSSGNPPGR